MIGAVLDASAVIALIKAEPGADKVAKVVANAQLSAVNFAEIVSYFIYHGLSADEADAMLKPLPVEIVEIDIELARMAGRLRAITAPAGLSLGDRFCLALAKRERRRVLTADRQWQEIAQPVGVQVELIR